MLALDAIEMKNNGIYKKVLFLLPTYAVCWLFMYLLTNQDLNLELAAEYFIQAWSFNGFVRPMYIWWLSNALFVVVATVYLVTNREGSREQ